MPCQGIYRNAEMRTVMGEDRSVLQLGGLSGLLAGITLIVSPILIAASGGGGTTEALLRKIQEIGRVYLFVPGLAMVSSLRARTDVPNGYGWASVVLGLLIAVSWAAAAGLNETGMEGPFLATAFFTMVALFLLLGWKLYSLSKAA